MQVRRCRRPPAPCRRPGPGGHRAACSAEPRPPPAPAPAAVDRGRPPVERSGPAGCAHEWAMPPERALESLGLLGVAPFCGAKPRRARGRRAGARRRRWRPPARRRANRSRRAASPQVDRRRRSASRAPPRASACGGAEHPGPPAAPLPRRRCRCRRRRPRSGWRPRLSGGDDQLDRRRARWSRRGVALGLGHQVQPAAPARTRSHAVRRRSVTIRSRHGTGLPSGPGDRRAP